MSTCFIPYLPTAIGIATSNSINIQHFITHSSYTFSLSDMLKMTLNFCSIIFSVRVGRITEFFSANMSFATNLPSFPQYGT